MKSNRSLLVAIAVFAVGGLAARQLEHMAHQSPAPPILPPPPISTPGPAAPLPTAFPLTIIDMEGRSITLPAPPRRIVTIAPSSTEILFALGLNDQVVADCTACDFPAEANAKPRVGSFNDTSVEKILAFNPDLVVADGFINPGLISQLTAANVHVLVLKAHTIAEAYDAIRLLGRATGQNQQAEKVVRDMQARIEVVRGTVAHAVTRPRVMIAYGADPIYTTGSDSFINDLITVAGGRNIVTGTQQTITSEQVILAEPEVIICDPGLTEHFKRMPGWRGVVPAISNSAFFSPSAAANMVRTGPRLAVAAEELAHFLHPELFTSDGKPAPDAAPGKP